MKAWRGRSLKEKKSAHPFPVSVLFPAHEEKI